MEIAGHAVRRFRTSVRGLVAVAGLVALGVLAEGPAPAAAQICPPFFPADFCMAPAPPNIRLTKTHTPAVVAPGGAMSYIITVNNPTAAAMTNFTVTDSLPPGFTTTSGTVTNGGICSFGQAVACFYFTLGPGATSTITVNGVVTGSFPAVLNNSVSYVTSTGPAPTGTATDWLFISRGELTSMDPTFTRPNSGNTALNCNAATPNVRYDQHVIQHPGGTLVVDLAGADSGHGTLADPFVALYNGGPSTRGGGFNPASPCSNLLGADDDSGTGFNSRLVVANLPAGTYTIVATAFSSSNLGTYVVNATAQTPSSVAAAALEPGPKP